MTIFCLYCATILEKQDELDDPDYDSTWACPGSMCDYRISFFEDEGTTDD